MLKVHRLLLHSDRCGGGRVTGAGTLATSRIVARIVTGKAPCSDATASSGKQLELVPSPRARDRLLERTPALQRLLGEFPRTR
jgi:hypothetical protein